MLQIWGIKSCLVYRLLFIYLLFACRFCSFSLKCSFNTDVCDSVANDEVDEDTTSSVPVIHLKSDCLEAEGVNLLGGGFVDTILTALPVSFV